MKTISRITVLPGILLCVALLAVTRAAWGADITFDCNVNINTNLTVANYSILFDLQVNRWIYATAIMSWDANIPLSITGGTSDGTQQGGDVIISGGSDPYDEDIGGGNVIIQGGECGSGSPPGDVRLRNKRSDHRGDDGLYTYGYVKLQTDDGTTRFWLQSDGTLNANSSFIDNARTLPQGDLMMGIFTNSPAH